jgi:voltage-gated potassium channel Kch
VVVRVVAPTEADGEHVGMTRLARAFVRFQNNPSSVRYASAAIISTMVILVLAGAILMRVFDSDNYPTFGEAVWFTLQTVTTVGYGDTTPTTAVGRIVASVVMLVSVGLVTVVTAVVTSILIGSLDRQRESVDRTEDTASREATHETLARIEAALATAHERLARLEELATARDDRPTG